jgi:hypothetical protein
VKQRVPGLDADDPVDEQPVVALKGAYGTARLGAETTAGLQMQGALHLRDLRGVAALREQAAGRLADGRRWCGRQQTGAGGCDGDAGTDPAGAS